MAAPAGTQIAPPVDDLAVLREARRVPRHRRASVILARLGIDPAAGVVPPGSLDRAVALFEAATATDLDAAA